MTENDCEASNDEYKDAKRIILWKRITKSNNKETYYKMSLYEYIRDLLTVMRLDSLEEITGKNINCKSFNY